MKKKVEKSKAWKEMSKLVYDEFHHIERNGMIVITHEEMTNVFINIISDFMKFQREGKIKVAVDELPKPTGKESKEA